MGVLTSTVALFVAPFAAQLLGADYSTRSSVPPSEAPIDGTIAAIEPEGATAPRFVLRSEFVLLLRAELFVRGAPNALTTEVDPSVTWSIFEQLMGEQLVLREAERAGSAEPDPEALGDLRARWIERMGGPPGLALLLASTGCTRGEFDLLLRRRSVALAYLLTRQAALVEPEESAVRQAFESGRFRARYPSAAPLSVARSVIQTELRWSALPSAERRYLRAAGSRVRVRVYSDAGGG